ncbi:hypothetical protein Salat_2028500 [Sesamum alatum]|uniref:Uncharacterized protein n=1 Tax=Sesamum alatum TaxID=300844 RepID=A0AAE1XZ75_9LAMI|nr:hypothetical protein Salat_2028500 [Sesamum alatum]
MNGLVRDSGLSDLSIRLVMTAGSRGGAGTGEAAEMGFGGTLMLSKSDATLQTCAASTTATAGRSAPWSAAVQICPLECRRADLPLGAPPVKRHPPGPSDEKGCVAAAAASNMMMRRLPFFSLFGVSVAVDQSVEKGVLDETDGDSSRLKWRGDGGNEEKVTVVHEFFFKLSRLWCPIAMSPFTSRWCPPADLSFARAAGVYFSVTSRACPWSGPPSEDRVTWPPPPRSGFCDVQIKTILFKR